jgi:hypothetical protein
MRMYNQAFDLYHTIFRIFQFLNRFNSDDLIEVDRLRIWDFYLLFPNKIHEVKLKKEEGDIRKLRNNYISKKDNPYEAVYENRKVFEKIKPYQRAALNCIASYGIINKEMLQQNRIVIINKDVLNKYISELGELSPKEKNIISLLTSHFYLMSLYGTDGLKDRTNLMESKYDAQ